MDRSSSAISLDANTVVITSDIPDERASDEFNANTVVIIHDIPDDTVDEVDRYDDSKSSAEDEIKHARRQARPGLRTIESMQETAIKRGGKCLSSIYKGLGENLEWECGDGHIWEATPRNIVHSESWCPKCNVNIGEELVRAAMVEAFPGKTFERTRREEWLGGLELDGYNSELKLAFEYQGIQHFERVPHFHREEGQFESQLSRDMLKQERCIQAGVFLLKIPYKIKHNDVRTMVRKMLVDQKYTIADTTMTDTAFYESCRAGSHNGARLELAKKIAIEKGGECLATKYISNDFKMPFRCRQGHEFAASLQDINQDRSRGPRFCQACGGAQKKGDDEIRARVETIGYKLLDIKTEHSGGKNRRILTVQCPANHTYDVIMDNLLSRNGSNRKRCKKCVQAELGKSLRVDTKEWAEKTGIELIGEYTGRNKISTWKCHKGHVFDARLDSLQSKKDRCSACWLVCYAQQQNFEILSEIHNNVKKGDAIRWRCLKCKQFVIVASRVSVSKKDIVCESCK